MDRLERWLDEVAASERTRPEVDAEAFLERLRPHLEGGYIEGGHLEAGHIEVGHIEVGHIEVGLQPPDPGPQRAAVLRTAPPWRRLLRAALIPLVAGLGFLAWQKATPSGEEFELIANLELLELLEALDPTDLSALGDPETVQIIEHWELLQDLPAEILEIDPENS